MGALYVHVGGLRDVWFSGICVLCIGFWVVEFLGSVGWIGLRGGW